MLSTSANPKRATDSRVKPLRFTADQPSLRSPAAPS